MICPSCEHSIIFIATRGGWIHTNAGTTCKDDCNTKILEAGKMAATATKVN